MLCVWGLFTQIEYKAHMDWRGTKTAFKTLPRDQQVRRMEECRRSGGISLVVDDSNLQFLKPTLQHMLHMLQRGMPLVAVNQFAHNSPCGWVWTYNDFNDYKEGRIGIIEYPDGNLIPRPGNMLVSFDEATVPTISISKAVK